MGQGLIFKNCLERYKVGLCMRSFIFLEEEKQGLTSYEDGRTVS